MEEEDQRGVAHIVEHLAFSATTRYTNHDIVKFLESIGAEFGPCQNAMTTADETIYELFVPVDKPELLSQAISILAEFSSEVISLSLCLLHFLVFIVFFSFHKKSIHHVFRFESQRKIWTKKEGLLWKNTEGIEMLLEGCKIRIGS